MPNFKRIGGGPWKSPDDLTWNDPAPSKSKTDVGSVCHRSKERFRLSIVGSDGVAKSTQPPKFNQPEMPQRQSIGARVTYSERLLDRPYNMYMYGLL